MEGPERVLGACSGAKEAHREVPREPIKFFGAPKGVPFRKGILGLHLGGPGRAKTGAEGPGEEQRSKILKP